MLSAIESLVVLVLSLILLRRSLLTIYKAFVRPHLVYLDIICDRADNESFKDLLERNQYHAAAAITSTMDISGTSLQYIYNELDIESVVDKGWYRNMTFFYKIVKNLAPKYLQRYLLPQALNQYSIRSNKKNLLTVLSSRTLSFSNIFVPYCIKKIVLLDCTYFSPSSYKFQINL